MEAISAMCEKDLPLAEAALLIAAYRDPSLDPGRYLARLDTMADAARALISPEPDFVAVVRGMTHYLASVEGFRGNTDEYADPRNSFLNEVLDRRLGIPITLCVLYIEIGSRLGLEARGVSFPGHFLVRFAADERVVVLDPFFGGLSLSEADLVERMRRFVPDEVRARNLLGEVLKGAPKMEILARMLRNLREIYAREEKLAEALIAADQAVLFSPGDATAIRDRGSLYERLEVPHAALTDYRDYLERVPGAPDAAEVHARMAALAAEGSRLN